MKRTALIVTMMICAHIASSQDFESFNFGDTRETIESFYTTTELHVVETPEKYIDTLQLNGQMNSHPAKIEFILIHNELASGSYYVAATGNSTNFGIIYPIYRKKYGDADNFYVKKKFQIASWWIGDDKLNMLEIYSDDNMTEVRFVWEDRIEDYIKELKKNKKNKKKKKKKSKK